MDIKTPYYMVHKDILDGLIFELKTALDKHWPNHIIGYSVKTNSMPWIVDYMRKSGLYAEVVSEDEYQLAEHIGFSNEIIYNGPVKNRESLIAAAEKGCIVNLDSKREIRWLVEENKPFRVGVRVNFDLEKNCPGQSQCGDQGGRFGFCYENGELSKAIELIKKSKLMLSGLHLHVSSSTRSLDIYKEIARVFNEIKERLHLNLDYLDLGGGYFGGVEGKPSFDDYFQTISGILRASISPRDTTLVVEPGISLIGAPIDYVSTVVDVKDTTYNRFVITDASRAAIDPLYKKSSYKMEIEYGDGGRKTCHKQVVCGYTCVENDRLHTMYDAYELQEGDRIIYNRVGAYTMCLSPLFINFFPPVYLLDDGIMTEIRKKWTAVDYLNKG